MKKLITLLIFSFCLGNIGFSQTTITGTVKDASGEALIGANILINGTSIGTITDVDGSFALSSSRSLPLTLSVSYTGFNTQEVTVTVNDPLTITLEAGIFTEEVVISASRRREKVMEAPAAISVLSAAKLKNSAQVLDPVKNLVNVPGVHILQTTGARLSLEMRGAAGLFTNAVFAMKDYRALVGAGLGYFDTTTSGLSNLDMERIEVVRGPGSALYGPSVTSGVVHFITKSPIDHPGTSVELAFGELNTLITGTRYAVANADKKVGFKLNAFYKQGDDFALKASDPDDAVQLAKFKNTVSRPNLIDGAVDPAGSGTVLLTAEDQDPDGDGVVNMQDDYWMFNVDGTLELRPSDDMNINISAGLSQSNVVFYNTQGEGVFQNRVIWGQARMQKGGLFVQGFVNHNDGGTDDRPSYLYQTGFLVPTGSTQLEGQVQYNFDTPNFLDATYTAGFDARYSKNETHSFIHGRNENDDDYGIFGAYLQGKFALTSKLDLVLAGRVDKFNFIDELEFAPRAALVYKVNNKHSFRASYNRASSPPNALQLNLDLLLANPVPGLFGLWINGMNEELTFGDNPTIDMTVPGFPNLPAGTPGLPLAIPYGAVTGDALLGALEQGISDAGFGAIWGGIESYLTGGYSPGGVTGNFDGFNLFTGAPLTAIDNPKAVIGKQNTLEFGYTGFIADKLKVSIDLYQLNSKNFFQPTAISPTIAFVNQNIAEDLGNTVTADLTPVIDDLLIAIIPDAGDRAAAAAQLAGAIGGGYNAAGESFWGAIAPLASIFGAVETTNTPQSDGVLVQGGYRVFGEVTYWGSDIALEYFINQNISVFGNYSWLQDNEFKEGEVGEPEGSPLIYTLNTPKSKFRLGVNFFNDIGFKGSLSFQHADEYSSTQGQFSGLVKARNLVDASVGYGFSNGLSLDVSAANVFDNEYRTLPLMPKIGRRVMLKATYHFGAN